MEILFKDLNIWRGLSVKKVKIFLDSTMWTLIL